jgi:spore coat protein A, manganese oxidase
MITVPRTAAAAFVCFVSMLLGCDDDDDVAGGVSIGDGGVDAPGTLAPSALTKFVDPVPSPRRLSAQGPDGGAGALTIGMWEIRQQLHRDLPPTTVWAYGETPELASYPGPTLDARVGVATDIRWVNRLPTRHLFDVDTSIHWAAPPYFP